MTEDRNEAPSRGPGIHNDDIPDIFSYHPPSADQTVAYEDVRRAARTLAFVIVASVPNCPDRTEAIRKLREVVMTANAAIALEGKY